MKFFLSQLPTFHYFSCNNPEKDPAASPIDIFTRHSFCVFERSHVLWTALWGLFTLLWEWQ